MHMAVLGGDRVEMNLYQAIRIVSTCCKCSVQHVLIFFFPHRNRGTQILPLVDLFENVKNLAVLTFKLPK